MTIDSWTTVLAGLAGLILGLLTDRARARGLWAALLGATLALAIIAGLTAYVIDGGTAAAPAIFVVALVIGHFVRRPRGSTVA